MAIEIKEYEGFKPKKSTQTKSNKTSKPASKPKKK